jgi:hypothetical protein
VLNNFLSSPTADKDTINIEIVVILDENRSSPCISHPACPKEE